MHAVCKAGKCTDRAVIRKVDAPNEKYILKDKNAVLNWFDIEMPEGRLSLNSKISDIVSVEEGRALFEKLISSLSVPGIVFDDKMLTMMNNFTLLRFVGMLGMMNVSFSKEELLSCIGESAANKLEVYICYLRRKTETGDGYRLIRTVRGKGYCII